MKTIKSIKKTKEVELGEIKRVDDRTAHNMVGSLWQYVSKSEWKSSKTTKSEPITDQVKTEKKSNPKQMDGVPSDEPFVKTRKKSKNEKDSKKD
jgi:hypothetical protein